MSKPNNLSQRVAELYGESTAPETPKKEKTNASLAQRVAELYGEQSAETPTKEEATKEQTYPLSPVGMELNAMESILKNPNMSEEEKRAAVGTIGKVNSPLGYDPMARANALAWDINNQKEVPTEDVAEKEGFDVERDFLGMSTKEMHEKPTDAAYVMPSLLSKSGEFNVGRKATKKEIKAAGDDAYLKAYGDEWLDENEERRKAEKAATKKHYDAAPEKVENDIAIFAPQRAKEIVATLPRVGDMVVYNGTEYRPEEVEYALTKAIFNKMDAYALENNLNYFKHRFKQETGMAYDAYLKQVTPARLDAIEKRVRQLRHLAGDALERELWSSGKVNMGGRTFHSGGVTPASESIVKQIDSRRSKSDRMFNDILEEIEHMRSKSTVDNFITGWDKEFDFYKMLPLAELWETMDQYAIMKKAEEGKVLSAQERYVLEAMQLQQELEELKGQLPKASNFNRLVGEAAGIAGTSTTILPQFLVGMGTTSSIGKLASVSLKQGYKTALKNAGKNFAVGTARGAVAATYSPYTYSNYYKKAKDQYSFNEDGSIKFDEQSKATMFLEAYIESMNEFSSEWWGVGMAEIAGEGMKWFGRMTNLENTMPMANKLLTISPEKRALYRNMGFTGDPVSEWASEMSGDFMSEVEKSLFGKGDFSMFERPDYWYTTIMGTGMFSAGMLATNVPSTVKVYKDVKAMKKEQSKILENMDSKSFANEVKTIGAMTNVDQQSMALAKANKNTNISKTDKIAADKYIKIGEDIKVRLGVAEESIRQKKFLAELEKNPIPAHTNGKIMEVTSADGTVYNILDGDYKDRSESSMLKVKNKATGEVSSILASSLPEQEAKEYSVAKVVEKRYNDMFDVDIEAERIKDLQDTYNSLEDASEEDVARLMEQYGHAPLKVGDKVALVDGRSVEVDEVHKDGTYTMHDVASGDVMSVPFYSVQSVDVVTAEAQAKLLADKENARIEEHVAEVGLQEALAPTEEATAESKEAEKVEKATPKQKPTEVHEGDIIEHNGREAVVMEVYDDGTAVINYDTTGRMNDIDTVNVADIIGNGEETPAMAEDAKEEMNTIEDVEEIPTDENGNIDFDSITNPKTFAKEYAARLGKEKAKQSVRNMTKQTQHLIEKLREKIAKATNANETIALEEQKKTAEERYKFYEDVLNEMYGTKVGIVENEYSADLNDPIRKKVQAFAELLGVRIEFVDEVDGGKANASIEGRDVKIAWAERQKTISFLLGHELTHRMQDVSPELYEKLKASIRKVEGEEAWNDRIESVRRAYNARGKQITTEGIEDEAVADYVGKLVETRDAFDNFLKAQNEENDNAVVRFFRNALRWMRNKLKKNDALKDVEKHLNALIADASKRIGDAPEIIEREPRLSARTNEEVTAELSALDAPYMEAVNNGDMVTAEKMVREAANAAGYTIEALHGTENAGFTTFDPARSQNGRTLFFTSTRKYAEAMAKGAYDNYDFGRRDIFTADKAKSFIEHFSNGDMRDLKVETYLTNDGGKTFVYQYNKMQKEANDPSYERVYEISQRRKPLVSRTEMMGDEGIVEYARNLDKQKPRLESSIYNVALRMENPLEIDLKGAPWNEIEFNGEVIDSWDLSEYAYENGYDGVIAHNQGVNNKWRGLAEVYHIFDPANVKSLNTVTYDDAGNVIPLSERFNPEKKDIRYSLATDVASILEEYDTEGVKYGSILDVADAIEGLIAESTEDTTELENILNDFRAAQDDARRWGNRMDSGGEEEFEEALRAYASQGQPKFSLQVSAEELAEIEAERKSIIETAKANGTYLKAPNGKDTNLTPEQWVDVRTSRFKNWFGDWEKTARIEKLRNSDSVSITGDEITPSDDMKEYRKNALKYGKTIRGEYKNSDTGATIIINKDSLTEVLHHDGSNVAHIQSIAAIPYMVESGIYITSEPVSENASKKLRNAKMAHYYVCGLNIGGVPYTVKFVVAEFESGDKYYDHSLTEIEKGELLNRAELSSTVAESKTPISDIKDKRLISILQTNSSKIVDENGEPKVVWHGGQFGISSFIPRQNMHFGTKKAAMQRILDEQWGYDNWLVQNEDGSYSWKYEDEYDEGNNEQSNKTFATEEEAMEDALLYFGNEVVVKPYFLNIRNIERTDDAQSAWDDAIEVIKAESDNVDGIVYENWYEDKGSDSYIAFEPNQVKSATDNVGTYNANNPDVRYSLITPEMDASYLDAVERGDMATAQRMVMEAAEKAGYINDESWRMNHRAPRKDEENANPFNTEKIVPEDFWEHPEWYTNIRHSSETRESYYAMKSAIDKYKRLMAEGKTEEAENVTITMYRGVDKTANKREASFRNGDWITPSRSYALLSAPYGKARVISQEVKLKDIWWDGNSIDEWGYDDGANYGYRDTKNNRKLLDPVTYDDNGNIIPLSERFNPRKEDIRYSLIGEKGAAALDAYEEATRRLDDLAVARAMEREGKTAKAIKMATGWERGADNKWRYELEDFFGMFHMYGGLRGDMKIDNGELQDFLDHEELFAAYPDMRHTKVYIVDAEEIKGYRGLHHPIKDAIYLARRQHDDMARTLFHEVQHAIQEREGFAKGAAPDAPHPILSKARQKRIAELKDLYAIMEARYNESKAKTEEWRKKRLEVYQARDKYPNEASWQAEFDFYDRTWNRHDNADRKAKRALEASKEEIENLKKNMPKLGAEGYRRVAGEIEARSTGARVGLNWRERLQSLARDMEGIAPKDQIFIEKAVTNGMAEEARLSIRTDNADAEEMYRAALLEEAALMEREAMENGEDNAQEIADRTGWVRLADGNWEYYGAGRVALSDEDAALRAAFRWLEAKKAIKKARVRKMYDGLIKDQKKMVSEVEKEKTAAYSKLKRNADKVDYILQGQAIESLPIEDQILADIALGQRIKWSDGEGKHGLKSELGLGSAKDERMGAVTMAAKDYVEDYVERLMERNGGYEKGLNDNDIRSAVLEVFRSYPSPKQALEELYARYKPQAESTQASEALAQLEYERDAALAEIEAEYKETFEDFDANPDKYVREHQESEAYNADIDMYVGSLTKARKKVEQLERQMSNRKLSEEEKKFAVQAVKKAIAEELKDGLGRYTRKYDIQRMMDAVNEARTPYAMLKAMDKAMTSLYDIKYRKEQARMESLVKMKLTYGETTTDPSTLLNRWVKEGKLSESVARKIMNDYWKGVNASGVSVAKFVDNDTRQVMVYINKHATLPELREYKEGVDYAKVIQEKTTAMREALEQKQDITPRQREMLEKAIGLLEDMWSAQAMAAKIAADRHNVKAFEVKVRDLTTRLADVNKQMRDLDASGQKVVETKDGYKNADILRKELQNEYGSLLAERQRAFEEFYSEMPDVINKMQGANKTLEKLIRDGNIELRKERAAREEHRKKLINEALADLDRYDAVNRSAFEPQKEAFGERAFNSVVRLAGAPLGSMDYMLRRFGRNAPMGEGRMYQRFAPAIHEANGRIYTSMGECRQQLDAKAKELFGKEYSKVQRTAETTMVKGATIKYNEEKTKVVNKGKHNEMRVTEVIPRERTLLVTEAMYMLATWEQTDGRKTLLRMGVTEEDMIALRNALKAMNPQWVEFIDWIVRDFLPSRRPKYDKAHRALFGISMANVPNYFPIKRRKDSISKEDDIAKEEEAPLGSTVVGSIIERTSSVTDIEVNTSFFEALNENVMTLEAWVEMAPIIADVNTLMSSNAVKNAMNDVYADFAHDFREAAKVATLQYKSKRPLADQILSTILGKLWATSKIAFRFYTAFKQLSSAILFYGYSADPRFWAKLLKYYTCGMVTDNTSLLQRMVVKGAGFVGYNDAVNMNIWGNIQWACDNLPSFKKRWDQGYAGYDIMTRTIGGRPYNKMRWADWMDKGVDAFARWGFKANAYVDAFTSAAGARAVYEYEMERLMKDGYTEEEARAIATFKAEYSFNSTQQSAEGLYLSPMQADGSLASTVLSTFMNAGYAMYRNTVIAGRELSKVGDSWTKEREFIEKQEMKRFLKPLEAKVDAELKAKVDDINKQRSEGVITTEEANERIKEAEAKADATKMEYFYQVKDAVQKRVKHKMRETKAKAALTLFLNGWLGQWAFNMMSQLPTLLMGIDDDDKEDYSWYFDLMMFAALPLSNMPLGGQVTQALYGNELEFIGSQGDLKRDWDSLTNNLEKEGYWEAAGIVGNMVLRYGLGVDLQSMFNIYAGVENMFEEGITVDNILMFMNAPSKQIRLIAGERREGETAQQYATRIMRLYSIFSSPEYNDYINTDEDGKVTVTGSPNRMTEKQVKWIQKNYDKEYLKDVTNKHYQGGYEAWTALEDEYKAAAKDVNTWDKIPTRMKNAKDQVNKRVKQRKTFVGTEENYYDILREQSEYMKSYIDKYNEYNEFK